jgi:hypothetical protein
VFDTVSSECNLIQCFNGEGDTRLTYEKHKVKEEILITLNVTINCSAFLHIVLEFLGPKSRPEDQAP